MIKMKYPLGGFLRAIDYLSVMKKFLNVLLVFSLSLLACFTANAVVTSDNLMGNKNFSWTLDDNGVFTIKGSGEMPNATDKNLPFKDYKKNVKSIVITGDITSIGDYVFYEMGNVTELTITAPIKHTGKYSFAHCTMLSSINFSNSEALDTIGEASFANCSSLPHINLPANVTTIEDFAFMYCTGATQLTLGDKVKTIGNYSFLYCSKLPNVLFHNSVTTIGESAFTYCSSLEWVTFGTGVNSIGDMAFAGCTGLKRVNSFNPVPPTMNCDYDSTCDKNVGNLNVFDKNTYDTARLRVARGYVETYKVADGWKHFKNSEIFTSVDAITSNALKVYANNGEIIVEGAEAADVVELYGINGQLLYRGTKKSITAPSTGVFIVKAAGKSFKTLVN